jgi:hypothetical protein
MFHDFQYLRDRKRQKRGVVVSVGDETGFAVGYSLVNSKAGDKFDFAIGRSKALGRAMQILADRKKAQNKDTNATVLTVPNSVYRQVEYFALKAERYYKNKKKAYCLYKQKDVLSEEENMKIKSMFDNKIVTVDKTPDEVEVPKLIPHGTTRLNEFFLKIANESFLIRKVDKQWKLVKV